MSEALHVVQNFNTSNFLMGIYSVYYLPMEPLSLIAFYRFGYSNNANSFSDYSIQASSPIFGTFSQLGANTGPVNQLVVIGFQCAISNNVLIS